MDLTPNDIRNYELPNKMRGYAKDEVDNLLEHVATALEEARQQNLKLSMEMESVKTQLAGLTQFEDTIKSAAIDARRNADMTVATAKQEAEMILSKARSEAEQIMIARTREVTEIENQITKLGLTRKSYLSKIRTTIQSHLEMIDEVEGVEAPGGSQNDSLTITQSTDVTTESRETVATQPSSEPIHTESDGAGMPAGDDDIAEDLKDAIRSDEPPAEQPIDPELAEALESYKKTTAEQGQDTGSTRPPIPSQGGVVETTARAEDIPAGFIAKEEDLSDETATDKVKLAEAKQSEENQSADASTESAAPEDLAEKLDEVAAKFEEEMNKTEQS